jgi:hypothetical protein
MTDTIDGPRGDGDIRHSHMSVGYRLLCVRLFDLGAAQEEQPDD